MDAERWKLLQDLFHQACALEPRHRPEFVAGICVRDAELGQQLESLLSDELATRDKPAGRSSEEAPIPSALLGPYKFVRLLGEGGMGSVYQARNIHTKQIVAIKVLRAGERSIVNRQRFATEQRALAQLNHPAIARLYASERFSDGTPCFVMEYVEGESLTQYCERLHCSVRDRVKLFRQVCEAVQHAHEHGIIHRDLKPSNILVKTDGTVRLLDFGIAKLLDAADDLTATSVQRAPMTLGYAAPEQISNGAVGTATDVYALGATLYELLTQKLPLPLEGLTPGEAEAVIRTRQPEKPSRMARRDTSWLGREDWDDLDLLCAMALHKEPARRYRTAYALLHDIDHWLRGEPLEAHEDSWFYRAHKFVQRNWKPLGLIASLAFFIAFGAIWFTLNLAKANEEALRQQAKTQRVEKFVLSLFDNGDPSVGPVKNANALTMLDRGRREAEALKADPDFRSEVYEVLGGLYAKLGRFNDANQLLQAAIAGSDSGLAPKAMGARLLQIGLLKEDESQYAAAEKFVHQGLNLIQQDRTSSKQDIAAAEADVGKVLLGEQKFKQALPLLQHAVQLQYGSDSPEQGDPQTLLLLGDANQEAGNYPQAVTLDLRTLALARREYGDAYPIVGNAWMQLGSVHFLQGNAPAAVSDYTRALSIYRNWYGEDHPDVVECIFVLGQAQMSAGHDEEARQTLRRGFAIASRVFPEAARDQRTVFALNALATLEQRAGNLEQARTDFLNMISGAKATYGPQGYPVAVGLNNLGSLYYETRNYRGAATCYNQALAILSLFMTTSNVELAKVQMNRGKALFHLGQKDQSRTDLEAAIPVLKKSGSKAKGLPEAEALLNQLTQVQTRR